MLLVVLSLALNKQPQLFINANVKCSLLHGDRSLADNLTKATIYGLNRLLRFKPQRFAQRHHCQYISCCGQVAVQVAVQAAVRLRFERNITLFTYKLLRLLCGLKII